MFCCFGTDSSDEIVSGNKYTKKSRVIKAFYFWKMELQHLICAEYADERQRVKNVMTRPIGYFMTQLPGQQIASKT
jgi:hypothetical protein